LTLGTKIDEVGTKGEPVESLSLALVPDMAMALEDLAIPLP
jgi:hypothetical protein